jgi:hypothetical protein
VTTDSAALGAVEHIGGPHHGALDRLIAILQILNASAGEHTAPSDKKHMRY